MSAQTLKVLRVLLMSARDELPGVEIGREAKLPSGTLYPILVRLEKAGWLDSRWEDADPQILGRPRKRFYRVTGLGARKANDAFADLAPPTGRFAWT